MAIQTTWKQGDSGPAVESIQQQLNQVGYMIAVDGMFGPDTTWAVRQFQLARGISADGIVGPETTVNLSAAIAAGWTAIEGSAGPVPKPASASAEPLPSYGPPYYGPMVGPPEAPAGSVPAMKQAGILSAPFVWIAGVGAAAWFLLKGDGKRSRGSSKRRRR